MNCQLKPGSKITGLIFLVLVLLFSSDLLLAEENLYQVLMEELQTLDQSLKNLSEKQQRQDELITQLENQTKTILNASNTSKPSYQKPSEQFNLLDNYISTGETISKQVQPQLNALETSLSETERGLKRSQSVNKVLIGVVTALVIYEAADLLITGFK